MRQCVLRHIQAIFTFTIFCKCEFSYFDIKLYNNIETSGEVKGSAGNALAVIIVIHIGELSEEERGKILNFLHSKFKFSPVPFNQEQKKTLKQNEYYSLKVNKAKEIEQLAME